ncbi:MAG: hypothetical protein FVQ84_22175, partial [Planctomycetes bacterium]|nr:hypothetical protein [Planctomycetota bacterium]
MRPVLSTSRFIYEGGSKIGKIQHFTMLVLMLSVANAWGAGFLDKFNRPNGDLGNGWGTQTNGTIEVKIVDNEVLIAGNQATD